MNIRMRCAARFLSLMVAALLAAGPVAADPQAKRASTKKSRTTVAKTAHSTAPMSEEQKAEHVMNRLGFGPRPGDLDRVRQMGVAVWIEQQLNPEKIDDSAIERRLEPMATLKMTNDDLAMNYPQAAQLRRIVEAVRSGQPVPPRAREFYEKFAEKLPKEFPNPGQGADPQQMLARMTPDQRRFFQQHSPQRIVVELQTAKLLRAVYSERQLYEQMVDFWTNHFNVHMGKGAVRWLVTTYEREAIRPNALGNFRDLLLATARHPAMLFYLDNFQSAAPGTRGGRGLNENYARELMELHTLGVDGGYTQKDVVEVARAFTGWTIRNPRQGAEFQFNPRMHDQGEKIVLGTKINAGGEKDAIQVIDLLVKHPSTARFVSTKLARHFVSDNPPAALVARMAETFTRSDGDIRQVLRAMFNAPEFFSSDAYRAKVKKPFELVASALRAGDADVRFSPPLLQAVASMGEPLYFCEPPTGYPDRAEAWINTGLMLNRVNFASELAAGQVQNVRLRPDAVRVPTLGEKTAAAISGETDPVKVAGLLLGSPEFQRR